MTPEERRAQAVARQQAAAEKRIRKAQLALEQAERIATDRVQRDEDRVRMVANSVAKALAERPWYGSFEELAQTAYAINGAQTDPYFGARKVTKSGKPVGLARFERALSSSLAKEDLAEQGVAIYRMGKLGAGIPSKQAVEEYHDKEQARIDRAVAAANERRELANRVFGTELAKIQLRALTDGGKGEEG